MIKTKARTTNEKTGSIVAAGVATASAAVAAILPNIRCLAHTVQRNRRKTNPRPAVPKCHMDLVLPPSYCETKKGENFLIKDSGEPDRYLMFGTDENLDILAKCSEWFADGTFFKEKFLFSQLYMIHGRYEGSVIPLVYTFLPNKSKEIYRAVLLELQRLRPEMEPRRIMIDFEMASIRAFQEIFPNAQVKGCYFHLRQSFIRHIQLGKLNTLYTDDEFALQIKKIIALTFVPPEDVFSTFQKLKKSTFYVKNIELLSGLLEYAETTWLGTPKRRNRGQKPPMFSIEMWNHYSSVVNDEPRTNNHAEGWFRKMSSQAQKSNSTIWTILDSIIEEQGSVEFQIGQIIAGYKLNYKRKRNKNFDEKLKQIVKNYKQRDTAKYLRGIAQNINL
uniref:AsIV-cont00009-ORF1 n=1 Tax=Apophua simplicipes ichnovirus TaxID=1329648 RepID=S5DR22_9VIRU|nr:AsIV-cont00009-ORF1 [Apophua simplicipes ichnovirus]